MRRKMALLITASVLGGTVFVSVPATANALEMLEMVGTTQELALTPIQGGPGIPVPMPIKMEERPESGLDPAAGKTETDSPHLSEQEALERLRSAFPDLTTAGEPDIQLDEGVPWGKMVWRIEGREATAPRPYLPGPPDGYSALVDANNGDIFQFNQYRPVPDALDELG